MDFYLKLVLGLLGVCPARIQVRARDVILGFNLREQMCERLHQPRSAGNKRSPALIKSRRLSWDRRTVHGTQATGGDLDELSVGQVQKGALVTNRGEISPPVLVLRVLLLLNLQF